MGAHYHYRCEICKRPTDARLCAVHKKGASTWRQEIVRLVRQGLTPIAAYVATRRNPRWAYRTFDYAAAVRECHARKLIDYEEYEGVLTRTTGGMAGRGRRR